MRIIRIDLLPHQKMKIGSDYPANFLLSGPMPKSVIDGLSRSVAGVEYEVVEAPDIRVPLSASTTHEIPPNPPVAADAEKRRG